MKGKEEKSKKIRIKREKQGNFKDLEKRITKKSKKDTGEIEVAEEYNA